MNQNPKIQNNLSFAFFGTPDIASKTLEILKENGYIPKVIVTNEDTHSGRGLSIHESPVSVFAKENDIPSLKPQKLNREFLDEITKYNLDLNIVVAYGKIIPESVINNPKLGTINIHYSLLPKYRGASPLEQALLNGDTNTGIAIQQMVYKLDAGAVINQKEIPIDINDTKENLKEKLIKLGAELLVNTLPDIIDRKINPITQDETRATICTKIKKEDGEINIENNEDNLNYNKYRAFYGWPGIYFFIEKNNKKLRIKINKASFKDNKFIIEKVTPEGKKEIDYQEFLKNYK